MKILLMSREFYPQISGVSRFMSEIVGLMDGYDFDIVALKIPGRKYGRFNFKEVNYPRYANTRYVQALYFFFSSISKAMSSDADVIVGNALVGSSCAAVAKLLTRKPLVSIIHDVDYVRKDVTQYSWLNKLFRKAIQRVIFSLSDRVIVVSEKVKKDIVELHGTDPSKIYVVPNAVRVDGTFNKMNKHGKKVIMFAGVMLRKKGINYLIEAFGKIRKSFTNTELWIVGLEDSKYKEELKAIASADESLGDVRFFGEVPSLWPYYDACDIFVMPSHHSEGFGIPCIEAAAFGKPVVATTIFEQTGVVVPGKTGLIVPVKDSDALAGAIGRLLSDGMLREKLGRNAKEFAKKFTWEKSAEKFEEVLKSI